MILCDHCDETETITWIRFMNTTEIRLMNASEMRFMNASEIILGNINICLKMLS